jgi:hypothetical protein
MPGEEPGTFFVRGRLEAVVGSRKKI